MSPQPDNNTKLQVALAQVNFTPGDLDGHVAKLKGIISAYCQSCDLIVFPELILHGHPSEQKPEGYLFRSMKAAHGFVSGEIRDHVRRCGARVIMGELRRQGDRFVNMATYLTAGSVQSYIKTHVHWTENFIPGKRLKCFDTPWGKLGISICFDSAFAEVWRALALMGAEVIVNISNVPQEFPAEYIHRRMQAAAVMNQAYVVYVNRPGPVFSGHSAVYDPRGELVTQMARDEGVVQASVDLEEVRRWREAESIYPNRRPLLYREVSARRKFWPIAPRRSRKKTA